MSIRLIPGDCRDVLATLPADSVHTCVTSPPYYALRSYLDASHADKHREIGSEPTPEAYLQTMVQVFRAIRRVLRSDGTCWVNMGDSYAANGSTPSFGSSDGELRRAVTERGDRRVPSGLKPKDLLMMPARLALALQQDGWWIRSAIVWAKPNPMPESVSDRPTSAYEMVYLLTKSAKYYYDADAVREGREGDTHSRGTKRNPPIDSAGIGHKDWVSYMTRDDEVTSRNLRNVWTLATHAYPQAHFATYPPELAERCIRAGTSERGCCAQCGKPWVRVTSSALYSSTYGDSRRADVPGSNDVKGNADQFGTRAFAERMRKETRTTGWQPGCAHDADIVPCTVLDPFAGASTTLLVAQRLQRDAIGIELNPEYVAMGQQRIEDEAGLFADVQTLADVPIDAQLATESLDYPEHRSAYSGLGDAQSSLWEWDHEQLPM